MRGKPTQANTIMVMIDNVNTTLITVVCDNGNIYRKLGAQEWSLVYQHEQ